VKLPCGFTVKEIVAVPDKLPDAPATVTVTVPVAAVPFAVSVKMLVVAAGFEENAALTPLGSPLTVKFTFPLNPLRGLMVIVAEPEVPWRNARLAGDAESVKLGCDEEEGQLLTRFAALTVPSPVAKSHPTVVP